MSNDDRAAFEAEKQHCIQEMSQDKSLFEFAVWSGMGVPIIQRPADIIALQEVIWESRPDIIIDTGVPRCVAWQEQRQSH